MPPYDNTSVRTKPCIICGESFTARGGWWGSETDLRRHTKFFMEISDFARLEQP